MSTVFSHMRALPSAAGHFLLWSLGRFLFLERKARGELTNTHSEVLQGRRRRRTGQRFHPCGRASFLLFTNCCFSCDRRTRAKAVPRLAVCVLSLRTTNEGRQNVYSLCPSLFLSLSPMRRRVASLRVALLVNIICSYLLRLISSELQRFSVSFCVCVSLLRSQTTPVVLLTLSLFAASKARRLGRIPPFPFLHRRPLPPVRNARFKRRRCRGSAGSRFRATATGRHAGSVARAYPPCNA